MNSPMSQRLIIGFLCSGGSTQNFLQLQTDVHYTPSSSVLFSIKWPVYVYRMRWLCSGDLGDVY